MLSKRRESLDSTTGTLIRRCLESGNFWRVLSICMVFGGWEAIGRAHVSVALPPLSSTMRALYRLLADGTLLTALGSTLQPLALGLLVAATSGVLFGIAMGLSRTLEWLTTVIFVVLQAAPLAAFVPLIVFVYGIGFTAKVIVVIALATPVIALNSFRGVRNVDPSLTQMGRIFLASRWQLIGKVIIPAASGMIVTSLRIGLASGFVGVIIAELLITPTGIGDLISYYSSLAKFAPMYASIFSIMAVSVLSISLLRLLEFRLLRPERRGGQSSAMASRRKSFITTKES